MKKIIIITLVLAVLHCVNAQPYNDVIKNNIEEIEKNLTILKTKYDYFESTFPLYLSIVALLLVIASGIYVYNHSKLKSALIEVRDAVDEANSAAKAATSFRDNLKKNINKKIENWPIYEFNSIKKYYVYSNEHDSYEKDFESLSIQVEVLEGLGSKPSDKALLYTAVYYYLSRKYICCLLYLNKIINDTIYRDYYLFKENVANEVGNVDMPLEALQKNVTIAKQDKVAREIHYKYILNNYKDVISICNRVFKHPDSYTLLSKRNAYVYYVAIMLEKYKTEDGFNYSELRANTNIVINKIRSVRNLLSISEAYRFKNWPFSHILDVNELSKISSEYNEFFDIKIIKNKNYEDDWNIDDI